jgi:RNA polymerase sigma factor (sigma-70 family)
MNENQDFSKKNIKAIHDVMDKLPEELNREPWIEEVAAETGLDVDDVRVLRNYKLESEDSMRDNFQLRFKMTIKNHELEKARMAKGWTQAQVGERIGCTGVTYSQIECCRAYPSYERMKKIAKVFGRSMESLFPEWLRMFSKQWDESDKERIVPANMLSLGSADVLSLSSGGREDMERMGELIIAKNVLGESMKDLSDREQDILRHRFINQETYEEVGKSFGITRERVRQIEAKALEKLREDKRIIQFAANK